jgi:hypothetical protein
MDAHHIAHRGMRAAPRVRPPIRYLSTPSVKMTLAEAKKILEARKAAAAPAEDK